MGTRSQVRGAVIDIVLGPRVAAVRRAVMAPRNHLDFYYEVGDPYSHLLTQVLDSVARDAGLCVRVFATPPPLPAFDPEPALRQQHAIRDATALAEEYGLEFVAVEQPDPHHEALANAAVVAMPPESVQLDRLREIGNAFWTRDTEALQRLADKRGVSRTEEVLARNHQRRQRAGHYLGGMIHHRGTWYWGIDRLRHLVADLRRDGRSVALPLHARKCETVPRPTELELFFSFRSPYAYLAVVRARKLAAALGLPLVVRPVLPALMRGLSVPRTKQLYIARDVAREARHSGIPFGKICDPLGPGIYRCLTVFDCATDHAQATDLACSIAQGVWSEAKDVTADDDLLSLAVRAGLEPKAVERALASDTAKTAAENRAESNRRALYDLGQWGVPTFRAGDLVVWGNDRLSMLAHRLGAPPGSWS